MPRNHRLCSADTRIQPSLALSDSQMPPGENFQRQEAGHTGSGDTDVYSLLGPPRGQGAGVLGKCGKKEHAPGQSREMMRGGKKARFGGKLRREMERVSTRLFFQGNGFFKAPSTLPK